MVKIVRSFNFKAQQYNQAPLNSQHSYGYNQSVQPHVNPIQQRSASGINIYLIFNRKYN